MTTSLKISDHLYLVTQPVSKAAPKKKVEVATNHIAVVDCSGSMYGEIGNIREQLKKKLPKLINEKDTFSMIWFSGRGEFGTLIEGEPVSTLKDLSDVNKAIDRWLKCVGLTGFKEPLEEVSKVVERIKKKRPDSAFSLFFMSDGCDNQWSRPDILKAVEKAAEGLASATFVEYGYYADRPLLTQMAEKCGGQLIFAEQFDKYEASFEAAMQNRPTGAPKIQVDIPTDAVEKVVWTRVDGALTTYAVESGAANVPEDTPAIYYLATSAVGTVSGDLNGAASSRTTGDDFDSAYAAVSLMSVRMKPKVVLPILKALGDVSLIEQFSGCFGKQKYSAFMDFAKDLSFNPKVRFSKGYDPKKVPRDDAFTVLELLQLLSGDEGNRMLLDHEQFKYARIGRGRVDSSENLTAEELDQIQQLTAKIASEKSAAKIKEIQKQISAITDAKQPALKFSQDEAEAKKGFPISSLTWNEDKPNVSVLVKKPGTVDISPRLPKEFKGKVPEQFPTFVYRNYAIIKDGLINVKVMPAVLSKDTLAQLEAKVKDGSAPEGLVTTHTDGTTLLHVEKLPVINQNMVNDVDPEDFFNRQWALTKAQAAQKVYNAFHKEMLPQVKAKGFVETYGGEASDWLKEQGITEHSGFGPKTVQAEAKDVYLAKELKVSLKGYSKLPSLKELKEMIAKGKVNPPGALMQPFYEEVEDFLKSKAYTGASAKDKVLEAWLDGQKKAKTAEVRRLIYEIARTTFTLIVGQVWFKGWKPEDNTLTVKDGPLAVVCTAEMREVEIKV
jgi:hypothetical protein